MQRIQGFMGIFFITLRRVTGEDKNLGTYSSPDKDYYVCKHQARQDV